MTAAELAAGTAGALAGAAAAAAALLSRLEAARRRTVPAAPARGADGENERAERLLDVMPFAVFIVDGANRVAVFNPAAAGLFGVDRARAIGRAVIEVIPSVELERMIEAARSGETRTQDVSFGFGARERYFGISVQPYEDGVIAIAADRTAYHANERARREFTGNVSHELRTPLSAIKLMLETVMLAEDDAEARALFLPQISAEVERMIRIVEDLLALARSESSALPLRLERLDLRELAAATVTMLAPRAEALGVALTLAPGSPVPVDADRDRVAQIVVNLLDNALRFTPAGGSVTVTTGAESGDALLRVRDTGVGIPYTDLPRIFERFYVVDRSRSRERAGTGLGLAIAKHLAESHGGRLEADSVYGEGATFTLRIPQTEIKVS